MRYAETLLTHLLCTCSVLATQVHFQLGTPSASESLSLTPRHLHGYSDASGIVFKDISAENTSLLDGRIHTRFVRRQRMTVNRPIVDEGQYVLGWEEDKVLGPDVQDRETLTELAMMTSNAYYEDDSHARWYNLSDRWRNDTTGHGWLPTDDGMRGHLYVSQDNSTVVISIKGTSAFLVGGTGPSVKKDKINDNLLFSCCCARVDWTWSTVCGCYRGGGDICNQTCLEDSLKDKELFYNVGLDLYNNVTYMYPEANIWLTGHSLGGALASLIGLTFGAPVVAFEAPAERLAAQRLHLPMPPSTQHVTHVYHSADPVPMGVCNGPLSYCAIAGFAFETRCHTGRTILYDTVTKLGWAASDLRTHRIQVVIEELLSRDWEVGLSVPEPRVETNCTDCDLWKFQG